MRVAWRLQRPGHCALVARPQPAADDRHEQPKNEAWSSLFHFIDPWIVNPRPRRVNKHLAQGQRLSSRSQTPIVELDQVKLKCSPIRSNRLPVSVTNEMIAWLLHGRGLSARRHKLPKAAELLTGQADRDGGNAILDRVHLFAGQEDFVIEVRPCRETGLPDIADDLALGDA